MMKHVLASSYMPTDFWFDKFGAPLYLGHVAGRVRNDMMILDIEHFLHFFENDRLRSSPCFGAFSSSSASFVVTSSRMPELFFSFRFVMFFRNVVPRVVGVVVTAVPFRRFVAVFSVPVLLSSRHFMVA